MKKTATRNPRRTPPGELRKEYQFDYRKAKPNRFAERLQKNSVAVVLDPDVAEVFTSSESVNTLLRSVLAALPTESKHRVES